MTDIEELIEKTTEEEGTEEDFMRAAALAYAKYLMLDRIRSYFLP